MSSSSIPSGGKDTAKDRVAMRQKAARVLDLQRHGQVVDKSQVAFTLSSAEVSGDFTPNDNRHKIDMAQHFIDLNIRKVSSSSISPNTKTSSDSCTEEFSRTSFSSEVSCTDEEEGVTEALLICEDFWVRTKAPLTYDMGMAYHVDDQEPVYAIARPVKCFKTKVNGNSTGQEGYLQCLTVETTGAPNSSHFALIASTQSWKYDTSLDIKLFKNGNEPSEFAFAECQIPLAEIFRKSLDIRRDMEKSRQSLTMVSSTDSNARKVILISEKSPIVSTRRKIRIGSLQFDIVFGNRRQLTSYICSTHPNSQLCRVGTSEEESSSSSSFSVTEQTDSFNSSMHTNSLAGLVVAPEKEDEEVLIMGSKEVPPDFQYLDFNKNVNVCAVSVQQTVDMVETTIGPKITAESRTRMENVIEELEKKVAALTNQVSVYGGKLSKTEREMSHLVEEVGQLRSDKMKYSVLVDHYCEQIESLNKDLESSTQKLAGNDKQLESLKGEVVGLKECQQGYERMITLIHSLTAPTTATNLDKFTLNRLQALLEQRQRQKIPKAEEAGGSWSQLVKEEQVNDLE